MKNHEVLESIIQRGPQENEQTEKFFPDFENFRFDFFFSKQKFFWFKFFFFLFQSFKVLDKPSSTT